MSKLDYLALKERIIKKYKSIEEFAFLVGISRQALYNILHNKHNCNFDIGWKIKKLLDLTDDEVEKLLICKKI